MSKGKKKIWKNIGHYLLVLLLAVWIAVLLRVLVVGFYVIPSDSMEPAIEPGDFVMVNKLYQGARLYRNFNFMRTGEEPQTYRLKGYAAICRNDVVVFNCPYRENRDTIQMNLSRLYVKRCIALPGDTIRIEKGFYRINGNKGYGNLEAQQWLSLLTEPEEGIRYTYPYDAAFNWDIRTFGPLYIPARGDTVDMNCINFCLYRKMIIYETQGELKCDTGRIFLNGRELSRYIFQRNWYFMAGDNVMNSQDSRYLGPIPEEFIVGKASWVLWAKDPVEHTWRWGRIWTKIK